MPGCVTIQQDSVSGNGPQTLKLKMLRLIHAHVAEALSMMESTHTINTSPADSESVPGAWIGSRISERTLGTSVGALEPSLITDLDLEDVQVAISYSS